MSIRTTAIGRRAVLQGGDKSKAYAKVPGPAVQSQSAKNIETRIKAEKIPEGDVRRRSLSEVMGFKGKK